MKLLKAFRNLDGDARRRATEIVDREIRHLEPHLKHFGDGLVRLEVTLSQANGKTRLQASLRLQLPSGVIVAREEGFEIEPVLRKAFDDLRHRVDRHVARLRHESEWKRPAHRRRIGALLPPARDAAEADRRKLFFDLIEDHLDTVYDVVRRELTYLECSGSVPEGYLSVRDLVDATILKGLERFEQRPTRFSIGDWLTRLALDTIEEEARAARRAGPEAAVSLEAEPEQPAVDPTGSDQEMYEFYQPDEVLRLEDLVVDESATDAETEAERHEAARMLHRAIAQLPALWRRVLIHVDLNDTTSEAAAALDGLEKDEVARIGDAARAFLRDRLAELGQPPELADRTLDALHRRSERLPQPLADRRRLERALLGQVREDEA